MKTFLLVLVTIIWGTTFVLIQDTVKFVNPFLIVSGRTFIAAFVMFIILKIKTPKLIFNKKSIIQGSIMGLLMATTFASQTIGLKYTSTGHSAFITGSAVIIVPIILLMIYKEIIKLQELIPILIVFVGLYLLTYNSGSQSENMWKGDLITLITMSSYAMHIILAGKYVKNDNVYSIVSYQFLSAGIASFIMSLFFGNSNPNVFNFNTIASILYLGIFATLFCYFIIVWVQKYESSVKVALVFTLEPVFAAFFGYLFIREKMNFNEIIGAISILIGLIIYQLLKIKKVSVKLSA